MPDDPVTTEPTEDESLDHDVPSDLVELHEILEWQAATGDTK